MKIDIYTKIILTVIAVCLTVIVARDMQIAPDAHAQVDPASQPADSWKILFRRSPPRDESDRQRLHVPDAKTCQ